jgi:hypothetical protein
MVMVMIIIIIIIITITTIIGSSFSVIERQTDRERCVKFVMA